MNLPPAAPAALARSRVGPGEPPTPDGPPPIRLEGVGKMALETGRTRLLAAGFVFALAFLAVGLRLVDLGLLRAGDEPRTARSETSQPFNAGRAEIVDRNGVVLATTLPTKSLYADPQRIRDPEATALALAGVLPELSPTELAAQLKLDRSFIWVKRNLTPRQQYEVNRLGLPGLNFQREFDRVYPMGPLVSQIVGFTDVDGNGLAGLERAFDNRLRSQDEALRLSIDIRIQHILSEELAGAIAEFRAIGGVGLVLDVDSGEVIAMASLPTFDPDQPGAAPAEARFNRATLGVYEMGSVFKIFTTAMALEEGIVDLNDGYDVRKPIKAARYVIRDYKPKNRWLSIPEIFIYSSNIGTVHMAMDAGTKTQQDFLSRLGLTRPAPIELPEIGQPMLPSPWREINTMTISYGHGLAVSPLQVTRAVGAMVNGGLLKPVTLLKAPDKEPLYHKRVISEETSRAMSWLMRLVVQYGTGRKANAAGYMVGGKTGTADKLVGRRYSNDARTAAFVGAFPMDDPRYVIFAMVDEPKGNDSTYGYATGGWVAAPVVRRVVERIGPLVGIRPRPAAEEAGVDEMLIPAKAGRFVLAAQ
jgi:cell division protein FtsI (penicillin-binding protein 3)